MKVQVINGAVVATSETQEEAAVLIKLTKRVEAAATANKRGRVSKFSTIEEKYAHKARYARAWYRKNKAKKAALEKGTPVAIINVDEGK